MITVIFGQCDNTTKTKIALGTTYKADREDGNLNDFLTRLWTVWYKSVNGGLSYMPYKMVVVVKTLHNFSNLKSNDPHAFKEELKIKFDAVLAIVRKFPNGTGVLEYLLKAETPPQNWGHYCPVALTPK